MPPGGDDRGAGEAAAPETVSASDAADGGTFVALCPVDAVEEGAGRAFRVRDRVVAVFRDGGRFFAFENTCPHAGGPLAEGTVIGGTVTCSWHCATFDLETGASLDSISRWDARTYPVGVRDGRIRVRLPLADDGEAAAPPEDHDGDGGETT